MFKEINKDKKRRFSRRRSQGKWKLNEVIQKNMLITGEFHQRNEKTYSISVGSLLYFIVIKILNLYIQLILNTIIFKFIKCYMF